MRLTLGFVLAWFGIQQTLNPSEWIDFIPAIVSNHSPIPATGLIHIHSAFLLLAAAGLVTGLFLVGASLLATAVILQVTISLLLDGGVAALIVRDVGLLGMAGALAIDPVRFWCLKSLRPHTKSRRAIRPVQPSLVATPSTAGTQE